MVKTRHQDVVEEELSTFVTTLSGGTGGNKAYERGVNVSIKIHLIVSYVLCHSFSLSEFAIDQLTDCQTESENQIFIMILFAILQAGH